MSQCHRHSHHDTVIWQSHQHIHIDLVEYFIRSVMNKLHWSIVHIIARHYIFIDKLLPESFQTTVWVAYWSTLFFQSGRLPILSPCAGANGAGV